MDAEACDTSVITCMMGAMWPVELYGHRSRISAAESVLVDVYMFLLRYLQSTRSHYSTATSHYIISTSTITPDFHMDLFHSVIRMFMTNFSLKLWVY